MPDSCYFQNAVTALGLDAERLLMLKKVPTPGMKRND